MELYFASLKDPFNKRILCFANVDMLSDKKHEDIYLRPLQPRLKKDMIRVIFKFDKVRLEMRE